VVVGEKKCIKFTSPPFFPSFIHKQLAVEVTSTARAARLAAWLLRRHALAAFGLYTAGFVAFVLRLRKGCYLYQFRQYAWTHLTLLFIFVPTSFFVSNIFDGIVWFLLPTSLVIVNDIGAYVAGFFFGRTPLISLSPKKTWEGFLGGAVATVAASWVLADVASRFPWLTCPRGDLSLGPLHCDPGPTYAVTTMSLADALPSGWESGAAGPLAQQIASTLARATFRARPMQLHAVALAAFASLVAPFGGFFASGFKRSAKIKDFGDSIPGHGGVTDRMDCQVVMAVFAYLYFNTFVAPPDPVTAASLAAAALALAPLERLALAARLANVAAADGLLGPGAAAELEAAVAAAAGGG
jgi:phosphatidate cytidylyltransferase